MSESFNNLKENLLRIMWAKDYTIWEMSVQCDISTSELEKIIGGKHKDIYLSTLERISNSLEVPIADLIGQKGGVT